MPDAHVSFGAAVRSVTLELGRERGLPAAYGVEVGPVHDGSPAAGAGIVTGDLITAVGGYTLLGGADQFRAAVGARQPGDTMTLSLVRVDGSAAEATVEFPREPASPAGDEDPAGG